MLDSLLRTRHLGRFTADLGIVSQPDGRRSGVSCRIIAFKLGVGTCGSKGLGLPFMEHSRGLRLGRAGHERGICRINPPDHVRQVFAIADRGPCREGIGRKCHCGSSSTGSPLGYEGLYGVLNFTRLVKTRGQRFYPVILPLAS